MRKFAGLLVAIAIAAYAIHGLSVGDLVMPYSWWSGGPVKHTRFLHLRGMWATGGSACLLLGAAGFALLSYGQIIASPAAKPGKAPYRKPAALLIGIGALFFLGISTLTHWFL